ncbi:MAG: THUMP domain-containing protein [Proteobacteria bacterium]|nr:THUMP domain-containing protein [Pseudomonadota bacterium]
MPDAERTVILLRFSGEIATKAKPTRTRNRVFVDTRDVRAADALSRVFGVQSLAVATVHPAEKLGELVRTAYEQFHGAVVGKRFAVRVRRVGDRSKIKLESRTTSVTCCTASWA